MTKEYLEAALSSEANISEYGGVQETNSPPTPPLVATNTNVNDTSNSTSTNADGNSNDSNNIPSSSNISIPILSPRGSIRKNMVWPEPPKQPAPRLSVSLSSSGADSATPATRTSKAYPPPSLPSGPLPPLVSLSYTSVISSSDENTTSGSTTNGENSTLRKHVRARENTLLVKTQWKDRVNQ